jgi:N-carbamoylputrescine amidase
MSATTVALIQQNCSDNLDANIDKTAAMIRSAKELGAGLVLLQELHTSLYFCQTQEVANFDLAESIPGRSTDRFGILARELGVVIVTSIFERRAPGIYHNSAVVIESDGSIAGIYRKMHIPDDPGFMEKFYFTPGDLGFKPIQTSAGKLGVLICWDQWYPEAARLMTLAGAEMLIYPTAIGWDPADSDEEKARQLDAWQTIQRGHAVANGIPVLAVNRVGHEKDPSGIGRGIDFWGSSFAAGCQGEILHSSSPSAEEIAIVTLQGSRVEEVRRIWPFLRDRRIDSYQNILQRYIDKP